MDDPTKILGDHVKVMMTQLAKILNKLFNGKLKPSHITTLSLVGHLPVAWALYDSRPVLAGILIVCFGLLDSLDGALARVQGTASKFGMFYDAVTDRLKEVIVYSGLAIYVSNNVPELDVWVVVAVAGTSLLVSYVKAKGEMAVSTKNHDVQELNRAFGGGIARYEIRMAILVIGLTVGFLAPLLRLIVALNLFTASSRFLEIANLLMKEDGKKRAKS